MLVCHCPPLDRRKSYRIAGSSHMVLSSVYAPCVTNNLRGIILLTLPLRSMSTCIRNKNLGCRAFFPQDLSFSSIYARAASFSSSLASLRTSVTHFFFIVDVVPSHSPRRFFKLFLNTVQASCCQSRTPSSSATPSLNCFISRSSVNFHAAQVFFPFLIFTSSSSL